MRTCMRPGERLNREESQGSCTNFLDSEATIATKSTEYDNCPDICHRQMAFRPCFTLTKPFSNTNCIKTSENCAHKKIIVPRKVRTTQVQQSKFWCRLTNFLFGSRVSKRAYKSLCNAHLTAYHGFSRTSRSWPKKSHEHKSATVEVFTWTVLIC